MLLSVIAMCGDLRAQVRDTVVMKDTLIPTWYPIAHKPVQAGALIATNWGWYNSGAIPDPMSLAGCDQYSAGTSRGIHIDLLSSIPFWGDVSNWSFGPTLGFRNWKGTFTWSEHTLTAAESGVQPLTIRHDLVADQSVILIGGRFAWQTGSLMLGGNASFGYAFGQSYERSEHLIDPGAHLLSGLRDTTVGSGKVSPAYRLIPALSLSAGYAVPLSAKLYAAPTVTAEWLPLGVTSFWHGIEVGAGVTFAYDLTPRTERVPVYVHEQVPVHEQIGEPLKPSPLKAWITATAVDRTGQESEVVRMQIEEVRTRHAYPDQRLVRI